MSLFSKLFRKSDPQPLGVGPLQPEHNSFRLPCSPTYPRADLGEANVIATDPLSDGNGAPLTSTLHGSAAPDFDQLECEMRHTVAALIGATEDY